jgi:hypothetical protein
MNGRKSNKEIDILVAENVIGWIREERQHKDLGYLVTAIDWYKITDGVRHNITHKAVYFKPSTNISDAWLVLEKLREIGIHSQIDVQKTTEYINQCMLHKKGLVLCRVSADTAPLAICMASLKAVGYEIQ